ncbi:MAG TPA: NAD(P)/FAD-dependent oxidoreductase [Paenibacillus sp.]|uniref:NAD(P)/FAD-dependent oxidoreductase n=1 Tax=Paenibacillus sp. TaxID=58172 RepID=UPI002D18D9EE|nr:NAD(P)/FAD-dependent oxidoreductase [Paenibacillus sp.]HUC93657.1 NAD(P)/FAD-dependent oxidoreductase [Paenibacillus sp.]
MIYDCAIVGGGIAGTQAAVQLGRYRHSVVVIDAADGRSTMCRKYHNLLGFPDGIGGPELRAIGRKQAERLGVQYIRGRATAARQEDDGFLVTVGDLAEVRARRLLIATGVKDRLPDFPALMPCLGISVFVCPDCDGYEVADRRTLVLGAGEAGLSMALELTHWTHNIVYINHEMKPVSVDKLAGLIEQGIAYIEQPIRELLTEDDRLKGVLLADGSVMAGDRAFVAFGGNDVRSSLAGQLGAKLAGNRHIVVDPRTKMTSVRHVWAAGDVTLHSEQAAVAMGDGNQAAIWMHKSLIGHVNWSKAGTLS